MGDSYLTPGWLAQFFEGWDDPCPLDTNDWDGLLREWGDPAFANIPYSKPMPWVEKAISESRKGKRVVLLVRADPSTKWWFKLVAEGAHFAFFHGRLDFIDGNQRGSFPYPSALVFLPRQEVMPMDGEGD